MVQADYLNRPLDCQAVSQCPKYTKIGMMTLVFCSKSGATDAKSELRHSLCARSDKRAAGERGYRSSIQCRAIIQKSRKSMTQSPFTSPATIVSHGGSPKYDLLASTVPP